MKHALNKLNHLSVIKYILLAFAFMTINKLEGDIYPYSAGLFSAAISLNCSITLTPLLFIGTLTLQGAYGILPAAGISAAFIIIVKLVYVKCKVKIKYETAIFTAVSLIGFLIIGNTQSTLTIEKRAAVTLLSSLLSVAFYVGGKAVSEKGLRAKFSNEEYAAIAMSAVIFGIGISNLLSPYIYKGAYFFIILCACYLLRFGFGTFISAIAGISLAFYYGDLRYVAASVVIGITADSFSRLSRYVAAIAVVLCDYLIDLIFGVYNGYFLFDFLPIVCASAIFIVIPRKPLAELKNKLENLNERRLTRAAINRNRLMLSNRLYELSGVFTEMAWAFSAFRKNGEYKERCKEAMTKEIFCGVCKECPNYAKCRKVEKESEEDIKKMIDVGIAKGKLSLIDIPSSFGNKCLKLNEITYCLNKMLSDYRSYAINAANVATGRQLIAEEAEGVSDILKGLALESGSLLKYQSKLEKGLASNLTKNGFYASELLIYGENENAVLSVVLDMKEFSLKKLQKIINATIGFNMTLTEKSNVTETKCCLSFKKAAEYDAVFGIAKVTKDGSEISGDTHAVSRISDDKFLVALSDGMGSGKNAEAISSVSLSLIESFYKAGMESSLILNTVNKLLSINAEDSFTALDVAVINLKTLNADFIKYGSPYGFIVNDGGVRIVEGNTLPLGILEELKPSVCSAYLTDGDTIILTSDGISDAFGSSQDVIEFLRKVPAKNPQNLSDEILSQAIALSDGKKNDDMTVLSVRLFKKRNAG